MLSTSFNLMDCNRLIKKLQIGYNTKCNLGVSVRGRPRVSKTYNGGPIPSTPAYFRARRNLIAKSGSVRESSIPKTTTGTQGGIESLFLPACDGSPSSSADKP